MTDHVDPRIEPAAIALYVAVQPRFRTPEGWDGIAGLWKREYCTQATAMIAAIDKAATITTVEGLDALPVGAVIIDCEGYPYRRVRQYPNVPSSWEGYELGEHLDVDTIDFPARVIHWGTDA